MATVPPGHRTARAVVAAVLIAVAISGSVSAMQAELPQRAFDGGFAIVMFVHDTWVTMQDSGGEDT